MRTPGWMKLVLVAVTAGGFAAGCDDKPLTTSNAGAQQAISQFKPLSLEQLDGWHGVKVLKTIKENRIECDIVFPATFGQSANEFDTLIYLIENRLSIRRASACDASQTIYQILDLILSLAIRHRDLNAATVLIRKGREGHAFAFDGEVAESYTDSYLLPVLEEFHSLQAFTNTDLSRAIAQDICGMLSFYEDVKDPKPKQRISALAKSLPARGGGEIARQLQKRCAELGINL